MEPGRGSLEVLSNHLLDWKVLHDAAGQSIGPFKTNLSRRTLESYTRGTNTENRTSRLDPFLYDFEAVSRDRYGASTIVVSPHLESTSERPKPCTHTQYELAKSAREARPPGFEIAARASWHHAIGWGGQRAYAAYRVGRFLARLPPDVSFRACDIQGLHLISRPCLSTP